VSDDLKRKLVMGTLYQAVWFALVTQATYGHSTLIALVCVAGTVGLVRVVSPSPVADLRFALIATAVGSLVDMVLIRLEVHTPARTLLPYPLPPFWLIALWFGFAVFLRSVLSHLHGRPLVQGALGAVGGPAAYWSGVRLGAMTMGSSAFVSTVILAMAWAVICVLFFTLSSRTDVADGRVA